MSIIEPFPEGFDQQDFYEEMFHSDDSQQFCHCDISEESQEEEGVCGVCGCKYEYGNNNNKQSIFINHRCPFVNWTNPISCTMDSERLS